MKGSFWKACSAARLNPVAPVNCEDGVVPLPKLVAAAEPLAEASGVGLSAGGCLSFWAEGSTAGLEDALLTAWVDAGSSARAKLKSCRQMLQRWKKINERLIVLKIVRFILIWRC